jgi:hypothetical protein
MRILPEAAIALGHVVASGLDAPILDSNDTRWNRLRFSYPSGFDLRDRFRGAPIGGAIGDAMGRSRGGTPISNFGLRISDWEG